MSDSNKGTYQMIFGIAIGAAVAVTAFLWKKQPEQKKVEQKEIPDQENRGKIPKKKLLRILKDLKSQLFSVCTRVSSLSKDISEDMTKNGEDNAVEKTSKFVFNQIRSVFQQKQSITPEELQQSLEVDYQDDPDVIESAEQIYEMYGDALRGEAPDLTVPKEVYKNISKDQILDIVEQVLKTVSQQYGLIFKQLKNEGEEQIEIHNAKFTKKINELKVSDIKRSILVQNGLGEYDMSPTEILGQVTQFFSNQDQEFQGRLDIKESAFQKVLVALKDNSLDGENEQEIDRIFNQLD